MTHDAVVLLVVTCPWESLVTFAGLLRRAGVRLVIIGLPTTPARWTRGLTAFVPVPGPPAAIVRAACRRWARQPHRYGWVCLGDEQGLAAMAALADSDDVLAPTARALLPWRHPAGAALLSKAGLQDQRGALAVPMIPGGVAHHAADLDRLWRAHGPTVVVKTPDDCAGAGVRMVDGPAALATVAAELVRRSGWPLVLQRRLTGRELVSTAAVVHGRAVLVEVSAKLEGYPTRMAPSWRRRVICHPAIVAETTRFVEALGLHGIAGLQWMEDHRHGRPWVMEAHLRPPSYLHALQRCGQPWTNAIRQIAGAEAPSATVSHSSPQDKATFDLFHLAILAGGRRGPVGLTESAVRAAVFGVDVPWWEPRRLGPKVALATRLAMAAPVHWLRARLPR